MTEADWTRATPCDGWTVRDLVNHVVGEELWLPPLLDGATIESVGSRFDGDLLGAAPAAAAADAAARAREAAAGVDLDVVVHLSSGDHPAASYLEQLCADHVIHGWDLSAALGIDYPFEEDLVAWCTLWFEPFEDSYRASGAVAARRIDPLPESGLPRLLAMSGRDIHWTAG